MQVTEGVNGSFLLTASRPGCAPMFTCCRNPTCASPESWIAWLSALRRMRTLLAAWLRLCRTHSAHSTGYVSHHDTRCVSALWNLIVRRSGLASRRLWSYAGVDNGFNHTSPSGVSSPRGVVLGVSQRGTRSLPGPGWNSRAHGHGCDSHNDHLHDVSSSLWVPRGNLCSSRFSPESSSHSGVSGNDVSRYRRQRGLSFDLSGVCDQRSPAAFFLDHCYVLTQFCSNSVLPGNRISHCAVKSVSGNRNYGRFS